MEKSTEIFFWNHLEASSEPTKRYLTREMAELFYRNGLVDNSRITWEIWQKNFSLFPEEEGKYIIRNPDLMKLKLFFYPGKLKKPFNPKQLKDGARPLNWLQDLFQKVLRFETTLTLAQWQQVITKQITPNFVSNDNFWLQDKSKQFLIQLIESHATPLRRLEKWYFEETSPGLAAAAPAVKKAVAPVVRDHFEMEPEKFSRMKALEQTYYQQEAKGPALNDQETLRILEELEQLDEDGDLTL